MPEPRPSDWDLLARERAAHDELYANRAIRWTERPLTWREYRHVTCVPPHEGGSLYGLDRRLFADRVEAALEALPRSAVLLDYGCGRAEMSVLAARRGHRVFGFDLSRVSVRQARRIAARAEVQDRTAFVVGNAQEIPFGSDSFDFVVGKMVLHHVIKYPGTNSELARVMRPGARALFLEGAAENSVLRFVRKFTVDEDLGDAPLTLSKLDEWAAPFGETRVIGYFLLYMLKRLGFHGYGDGWQRDRNWIGRRRLFNTMLKGCLRVDELIVNERPWADRIAGRYVIEFRL